jgi:hypothetical protein
LLVAAFASMTPPVPLRANLSIGALTQPAEFYRLCSWLRSCFPLRMLGMRWLIASALTTFSLVAACGTDSGTSPESSGGAAPATGGRAAPTGGASSAGAGGAAPSGGSAGRAATGGTASGGSVNGTASGGSASGGSVNGTASGGSASGGSASGGSASGGSVNGTASGGEGGSGGVPCGSKTCGENQYCKAPCSGAPPPEPVMVEPTCADLPARCIGDTSCECICGGTGFCRDGEPEVQCGCA